MLFAILSNVSLPGKVSTLSHSSRKTLESLSSGEESDKAFTNHATRKGWLRTFVKEFSTS